MEVADLIYNENERLKALKGYSVLDTLAEEEFDDITRIASEICETPISLISLIDSKRQWFKSHRGLSLTETPRDYAFCAHAINSPGNIFIVKDAREDVRFFDNPLVTLFPNIIFYAGVPLTNPDGFSLGTICVIDHKPRELTPSQLESLRSLANQVVRLFEAKRVNRLLNESQNEIKARNVELEQFAYVVSHDIKSPLNNIIGLTDLLKSHGIANTGKESEEIMSLLTNSTVRLKNLIDGVISHCIAGSAAIYEKSEIDLENLFKEIIDLLDARHEFVFTYDLKPNRILSNEVAINQIFMNLVSNAIKYNEKEQVKININSSGDDEFYFFSIKDNGQGIDEKEFSKIFETFVTLGTKDRFNNIGTGIGLSTVRKLIEKMGGTIQVISEVGVGSEFRFCVK